MKTRWLAIALLAAASPSAATSEQLVAAAAAYATEPSCSNASSLLGLIPDRELARDEWPDSKAAEALFGLLTPLEAQLFRGDACAARLAFRLRRASDAAFSEELEVTLGALATMRPLLYLQEAAHSKLGCSGVAAFDPDLSESETRAERQLRLKRLQEPVPAALEVTRKQCVHLLKSSP